MHLCMQPCSTLLDWQLKKCFATCGILIFVCFCFTSILQLLLELLRTIFCHVFSELSQTSLLSEALTCRQELIKMVYAGVPL